VRLTTERVEALGLAAANQGNQPLADACRLALWNKDSNIRAMALSVVWDLLQRQEETSCGKNASST
jgi:hypothetical protein